MTTREKVIAFANTIIAEDYGYTLWNEQLGKVWHTAGDGCPSRTYPEDNEYNQTFYEDIEEGFLAIDGVKEVEIGDETDPVDEETYKLLPGWEVISAGANHNIPLDELIKEFSED